jgi:hypothetical protein
MKGSKEGGQLQVRGTTFRSSESSNTEDSNPRRRRSYKEIHVPRFLFAVRVSSRYNVHRRIGKPQTDAPYTDNKSNQSLSVGTGWAYILCMAFLDSDRPNSPSHVSHDFFKAGVARYVA